MNTIKRAEMLELVKMLTDIILDNKEVLEMPKQCLAELCIAARWRHEVELTELSKPTQEFIEEVRANEA